MARIVVGKEARLIEKELENLDAATERVNW